MDQANQSKPPTNQQTNTFEDVRLQMNALFNLEEIQTLAFDLNIDYDNLAGQTKNGKIISLLKHSAENERLPVLEEKLQKRRPQADWTSLDSLYLPFRLQIDQNRANFLNILKTTWIDGFLHQSLHDEVIKLTMIKANGDMLARESRRSWQMVKQQTGQPDEVIPLDKPVGEVFDECGRGLLILGEPGSGKTITLLQLAEGLLAEAAFPGQPMPIVLNLSSWAQEKQALAEWLVAEIFLQYGVSRGLARQWLEQNNLIYLLDGLDEVAAEARDDCIAAINQFKEAKPGEPGVVQMVVCSRTADYALLNQRLNLNTAIQIQPLSDEQVDDYLSHEKLELQAVQAMLAHDPPLRELTRSPLLLNVMTLAYKGKKREELQTLDTVAARRQHLFDAYIDAMFAHRLLSLESAYSEADARHWLMEVAYCLTEHNVSELYLEKLQPGWLPEGKPRHHYTVIYAMIFAVMFGLIGAMIFGPIGGIVSGPKGGLKAGLIGGLIIGLLFWLISGLKSGLIFGLNTDQEYIKSIEELKWHPPPYNPLEFIRKGLTYGLIGALCIGLFVALFAGLLGGLIYGLIFGLSVVLFIGLIKLPDFLDAGIRMEESREKLEPNQGIRSSRRNALRMGLLYGLIYGLIFGLSIGFVFALNYGLNRGLFLGLIMGMSIGLFSGILKYGGDTYVQHFTLRWLLARQNILPYPLRDKKLIAYLDAMVERILLRRIGNGYIFIHRSLMEHFAAKHPSRE